jgi:hypothetical protein
MCTYGIIVDGAVVAPFSVPMTVKSNQPVFVSDTVSLKRRVDRRPAHRWEISSKIAPDPKGNVFMTELITKGLWSTFTVLWPQSIGAAKARNCSSVPAVTNGVSGATTVTVTNVVKTNSAISVAIPRGTYIKFSNHNKVYMLTQDVPAIGNTPTAINVFPTLRANVGSGVTIKYADDIEVQMYLETDTTIGMVYEDGLLMDPGQMKFVEAQ